MLQFMVRSDCVCSMATIIAMNVTRIPSTIFLHTSFITGIFARIKVSKTASDVT